PFRPQGGIERRRLAGKLGVQVAEPGGLVQVRVGESFDAERHRPCGVVRHVCVIPLQRGQSMERTSWGRTSQTSQGPPCRRLWPFSVFPGARRASGGSLTWPVSARYAASACRWNTFGVPAGQWLRPQSRAHECPGGKRVLRSMVITLNGESYELDQPVTVSALLERLDIDPRRVAIEHNL